jgi:Arc/MetJ-type ribon-helix-helix transcriptional regulator
MHRLEALVEQLPPDMVQEVQNFAELLLQKYAAGDRATPEFPWAGALKELRASYTSVELQHQIAEWRAPDCHVTKIISVELPERITAEINVLIENGWFADETEIIRAALWEFVRRNHFALAEQFQRADIAWALQQHRNAQAAEPVR